MKRQAKYAGFLLAIEGIDGTGKTTQARLVEERLLARKLSVLRTREPTTGQWGQKLRESAVTGRLGLEEEVELFLKDRREHVETVIRPALRTGRVVILDRYYFSNMAYQGARGMDPVEIMRRNEMFAPEPDLLVILDMDPGGGLERVKSRGGRADHFEETDALGKAREIFNGIRKPYLWRLDAGQEAETIRDLIVGRFLEVYAERGGHSEGKPRENST